MDNLTNASSPNFPTSELVKIPYYVSNLLLYPLICLFGIAGNALTLVVAGSEKKKTPTSYLIISLSIADMVTLMCTLLYLSTRIFQSLLPTATTHLTRYAPSYAFLLLSMVLRRVSKTLLILISLERLVATRLPLRVREICTVRKALISIVTVSTVVIGLGVPNVVDIIIVQVRVVEAGGEIYGGYPAMAREFRRYYSHMTRHMSFLLQINRFAFDLFSLLVVLVSNLLIVTSMTKFQKAKSDGTTNQTRSVRSKQITKMLLCVCFAYLILCAPLDLLSFAVNFFNLRYITASVSLIFDILASLNHVVNFLVYGAFNLRYRQAYLHLFMRCSCCKKTTLSKEDKNGITRIEEKSDHQDVGSTSNTQL